MEINETAEDVAEAIRRATDALWDLITVDRGDAGPDERDQLIDDLRDRLTEESDDGLSTDDVEGLFNRLIDHLPRQGVDVDTLRTALSEITVRAASAPAPRAPQVIRQVVEKPVVQRIVEQRTVHVTEKVQATHVTNNNVTNVLHESDTVVDNRAITTINAKGDVTFDQRIDNHTVATGKGGVAVNGNVDQSVINTGANKGVIAGDDATLDDSVVGDGNVQVNDSTVGALSGRGNATNLQGENVNTGSGDVVSAHAGGDVQAVTGSGNRLSGDADVEFDRVDGPANVAVGSENQQQAVEDNSTTMQDNDTFRQDTTVSASQTTHVEDNSIASVSADVTGSDNALMASVSAPDLDQPDHALGAGFDDQGRSDAGGFAGDHDGLDDDLD